MSCFRKSNPLTTFPFHLGKEMEAEEKHKVNMQFPATLVAFPCPSMDINNFTIKSMVKGIGRMYIEGVCVVRT